MATVLIADDQPASRRLLVTLLGYNGHRPIEAADGAEALALAQSEHPDLVITDLLMPVMDGYEFARQLRAIPEIAQTPVIFYSANYVQSEAQVLAKACGVDHLLQKPSEPEEILRTVQTALEGAGQSSGPLSNDAFSRNHQRLLTDKLAKKVDDLEKCIDEHKRTEEVLHCQAAELARSNADLEQFAYMSSHDLQEPLRMVASYMDLLELEYKDVLGEGGREYIAYAAEGADRMRRLIKDMLAFSRLGTSGQEMSPTSSEAVLTDALTDLQLAISENGALITHDPLPTITADVSQLTMLFENLIGNALKFHGSHPPRVHLSAVSRETEWEFTVRDNGIGIAPKHTDRIFIIFQRLHSRDKYSGTGIGLAVCRRIVERHGGHIWVEANPEQGSAFHFTIRNNESG